MFTNYRSIKNKNMDQFLLNPQEKIILLARQHWFVIVTKLIILFFFMFLISLSSFLFFFFLVSSPLLFFTSIILLTVTTINMTTKILVDWYFHIYVVTTKKILEVSYAPLFSHLINEVLLDQVRCTEIDIQTGGILNELIDRGNVTFTFDRPTHREEFSFTNVKNPKQIGMMLGEYLDVIQQYYASSPLWYRNHNNHKMQYTEEIFPRLALG